MTARHLTILVAAAIGLTSPAGAQGTGGGGASAGAGGSTAANGTGTASSGTATGTGTATSGTATGAGTATSGFSGSAGANVGTRSVNPSAIGATENATIGIGPNAALPTGSPASAQAARNTGAGRAANGVPIGSPGSGIGSPEQPIDPRARY